MITVAIVEDNMNTLTYLKAILTGSWGFQVIGAYTTGKAALEALKETQPEVLLCDLNLPDMPGIEVIQAVHDRYEKVDILVLTVHEEKEYIIPAIKAGASGYILKGASPAELVNAVLEIKKGGAPMSPKIARYVLSEFRPQECRRTGAELSDREKEVLDGFANSLSEKKLADKLGLSRHTIHHHVKNIYSKLQVKSKTEAVLKARDRGLL